MAAAFIKYNQFVADLANKVHNLNSDTLKVALTNRAPVATDTNYSGISEIAAGGGYSTGGYAITGQSATQTNGVLKLLGALPSPTITATGAIATWRYAVLYNVTAGGNLIGAFDNGAAVSLTSGQTFTIALDPTNGILQDS